MNESSLPRLPKERPAPRLKIINAVPEKPVLPFVQELQLVDGATPLVIAHWHAPLGDDGVIQILDLQVDPLHQRVGHGSTMIRAIYDQAKVLFRNLEMKPRRVWMNVEQKKQVIGRAFLSRHGFHHVSTIKNLLRKQEGLIYQRSFD